MLGDDVAAEIGQRLRRGGLLGGIEPGVDHHELGGDLRIDGLSGEREGVHAHHHFRDLERPDKADRSGLRHHAGDRADDRAALIETRIVGADIVGALVAGAMFPFDVGELLRGLDRLIHVAVGGGEDELVALLGEVLHHRNRARVLLHVLDIVGDDLTFQRVDQRLAALFVRPRPAVVADRAEIDEADLERLGGEAAASQGGQRQPAAAAVFMRCRRVIVLIVSLPDEFCWRSSVGQERPAEAGRGFASGDLAGRYDSERDDGCDVGHRRPELRRQE